MGSVGLSAALVLPLVSPCNFVVEPNISYFLLGTWWGHNLSESEDNTQEEEIETQEKCTSLDDIVCTPGWNKV